MKCSANLIEKIDDRYMATANGAILSCFGGKLRRLKHYKNKKGYLTVCMHGRTVSVHRTIATAFHGPRPTNTHQVMHLDNQRDNNSASNLRWGTPRENTQQMIRDGRAKGCCVKLERTKDIKEACRSSMKNSEIARMFGVNSSYISMVRSGKKGGGL